MKIILLFDSDDILEYTFREYTLQDDIAKALKDGRIVKIDFRHPEFAEHFHARLE